MVEFALILPLLALLLVMAVDFGRVFFGWIALQNATRIAADTASQRANAWPSADGNLEIEWRDDYETFITQDLQAANCDFPTPHPDPVFTNANAGDPDDDGDHDFGDLVTVRLECEFSLITPLAESMLGGPVQMVAESTFADQRPRGRRRARSAAPAAGAVRPAGGHDGYRACAVGRRPREWELQPVPGGLPQHDRGESEPGLSAHLPLGAPHPAERHVHHGRHRRGPARPGLHWMRRAAEPRATRFG